jgi:uncharacterized membrane protein YhhN
VGQDLAHKRPWLLASLVFGLSYPLILALNVPGIGVIIWKMGALACLVPYALRKHHNGEFRILAAVLALCALGDGLVEISIGTGAIAFGLAHILAIWLYSKHSRVKPTPSQRLLVITVFVLTPFIAYSLAGIEAAAYSVLLSAMAAMAWNSNFPRYRVGMGAMLFVVSDLLLFGREGGALAHIPAIGPAIDPAIWYSYYAGMVLIATGIVQTLIKRGYSSEEEGPSS